MDFLRGKPVEHDNVNHPAHYTEGFSSLTVECIDITRNLPFDLGNAFKYVWRAGRKGGPEKAMEDLDKAVWYLNDWQEWPWYSGPCKNAVPLFSLIETDGSPRWRALRWIVYNKPEEAIQAINRMRQEGCV